MKKQLSIFSLLVVFCLTMNAQQKVALHSNGTTTIFSSTTPLIDAYTAAIAGDTLYVSGGSFTLPATVDKPLVIIGAGFHPDYTSATLPSIMVNTFSIGPNADGLYIEGLELQDVIKFYTYDTDNVTIIRCIINGNIDTQNGASSGAVSDNLSIIQCIVKGIIVFDGYTNSVAVNSIIQGIIQYSTNNVFQNNIFLRDPASYGTLYYCNNNTVENNIFHTTHGVTSGTGNIFRNNLFTLASPSDLGGASYDFNNYKGIDLSTVYVSQSGYDFTYNDDYHLQAAASSTYLGTDGSEVGLFGGLLPYKDGALPMNPHINAKTISNTTNGNGLLNISITVNAQQQ